MKQIHKVRGAGLQLKTGWVSLQAGLSPEESSALQPSCVGPGVSAGCLPLCCWAPTTHGLGSYRWYVTLEREAPKDI